MKSVRPVHIHVSNNGIMSAALALLASSSPRAERGKHSLDALAA